MYYRYFGLNAPPFEFTTSPAALYLGKEHNEALAALEWGLLREPSGYMLFIGEPGTGKTTLLCALLARHYDNVRAVYLNQPKLSFEELLVRITRQLGVEPEHLSRLELLESFQRYLGQLDAQTRVVLVLDEAQALSDASFEELRLLANQGPLERHTLQVVLAGQPELASRLHSPALKQLNERIGARAVLHPLATAEIYEYIEHLVAARGGQSQRIFSPAALAAVARHSRGIPRRVNVLCHNAMLTAFSCNAPKVEANVMNEAVQEYDHFVGEPADSGASARDTSSPFGWLSGYRLSFRWLSWATPLVALVVALGLMLAAGLLGMRFRGATTATEYKPAVTAPTLPPTLPSVPAPAKLSLALPETKLATASAPKPIRPLDCAAGVDGKCRSGAPPPVKPVSAVAGPVLVAEHSGAPAQVVVRSGDTISAIAIRYFGTARAVTNVAQKNPQITDVDRIYPGEQVYLPAPEHSATDNR